MCLCFVYAEQLVAQNSQLRPYTIAEGLPQSQVYDVAQDEKGFLWLGTQGGGLANFDGETFSVWNENDGLLSNYIHALHSANDSVFVGTNRGLSIKTKRGFTNYEIPLIQQFYRYKNNLYLATRKGIYAYSQKSGPKKIPIHPEIDASSINTIYFGGDHFWLATDNGLWKCNALNATAGEISKLESNNFTAVLQHNNKIIAATFDDGVFVMDQENPKNAFLMPEPLGVNSMSVYKNELWMATHNGVSVIETKNFDVVKQLHTGNGLAAPHVRKVFCDSRNNLWIATSGGGLYKYFQNNFVHYDKRNGLKGNRIYAVHRAKDEIWLSSSEAGLTKIDSSGIHPLPNKNPFYKVKIKTIASDANGNIWAGSDDRGILFRETKTTDSLVLRSQNSFQIQIDTIPVTRTTEHSIDERKGFPSDWIRKLVVDDEYVWAATYANGIVKFNYFSGNDSLVIRKTFGKREGMTDLLLKDMVKDESGRLWFSSQNGHLGYIEAGKLTMLDTPLEGLTAIGTVRFHNDRLFLGTSGKGIWYSNSGTPDNFQQLKGAKNSASNNIYQLIFDDEGNLWAGTEKGVDKIVLNASNEIMEVYHFGRNDGFLGIETCLNAVDKDGKGNLWFGAIYGLTKHIPSQNTRTSLPPRVYFTGVEEAYKAIDSIDLRQWTNSNKVLQLNPDQTQLGFSFRTVDLDHPNAIAYRFKLDDNEWSPWSASRQQNFAGLAYGPHTFSVQSRNHSWEESDPIAFRFFIDSPLYKKNWFQWTVLASVLMVLLSLVWWYVRKLKSKNRAAQARLKTQNYLLTLEQKALRLQMNPHFIFNVLNGIKAMATDKPEKMNTTINSFAVLLRDTLNNSRKETIALDQEVKTLEHYIAVEKLMAPKPFTHSIDVKTTPGAEEILIPPMLIQPFVENAIRHGILKGTREGVLQVAFHSTDTHLHCTVSDNGMGIFSSQQKKAKTDHQSMALVVTKERLESISGKESLQINEIKKEDGTVGGTRITFAIPLVTDF